LQDRVEVLRRRRRGKGRVRVRIRGGRRGRVRGRVSVEFLVAVVHAREA